MINSSYFKRINGLNCSEYLIRAVANYYERDYEMMFIKSWGFDLDYSKNIFEDDFISDHVADSWNYLKMYHGIEIRTHEFERYEDFEEFVRRKLKNDEPVMVFVDLYWVPWVVQDYQREHWSHMVLIVGEDSTGWLCYDFFSTEENILPYDHMVKCFCDAYDFELHTYSDINVEQGKMEIKQGLLDGLIKTNAFEKMRHLSECILTDIKRNMIDHSVTLGDFQTCDLMEKLNRLSQRRSQFALMLEYLFEHSIGNREINLAIIHLSFCAACWKSVWGLLQKAYLMKDPSSVIEKASKKIKEISYIEQRICESFLNEQKIILEGNKFYVNNSMQQVWKNMEIPIGCFANHRSIYINENNSASSLDDIFIIEDEMLRKRKISIGNITYNLCTADLQFDNISCVGQQIPIKKKIVGFSLLSNADFAHQTERIIICSHDREKKLPFNVTYSQWHTAEFGQRVVWKGSAGMMREGVVETHPLQICIYESFWGWKQSFYAHNIVLPYCPNIHIYGIAIYFY